MTASIEITRRQALSGLAAASSSLPLASCRTPALAQPTAAGEDQALQLLDSIAENLLWLQPEGATALGIDKERRAPLRSMLADRSAAGQQRIAATLRADLARANALDS